MVLRWAQIPKMKYEVMGGVYNMLPSESLARIMNANLRLVGGYPFTENENVFGKKIQESFTGSIPKLETTNEISEFKEMKSGGSTDVADVSWMVPTTGLMTATWVPGTTAHSWQAVAAGGMSIGHKGMIVAAKTMALTAIDLYNSPTTIEECWKEMRKRRGENFKYEALIGDRKPALDYRK